MAIRNVYGAVVSLVDARTDCEGRYNLASNILLFYPRAVCDQYGESEYGNVFEQRGP